MKRLLLISFLLSSVSAFGAVTLVNTFTNKDADVSSLTIPTTVSGANFLLLAVQTRSSSVNVDAATYNGDALTHLATESSNDGNLIELWYLTAPDSGTHDVVVTWASSATRVTAAVTTWSGVDQTTPLGTVNENHANASPAPTNYCASASGDLSVGVFGISDFGDIGPGETSVFNDGFAPSGNNLLVTYKTASSPVTEFGNTAGSYWVGLAVALKPSTGPATLYVATDGDNGGTGAIDDPWADIRYGVMTMNGGDTLTIRGGTYNDDGFEIDEIKSGPSTNQPTVIQSYPGEWAVYYPTIGNTNTQTGAGPHGMLISSKSNIVLSTFEINALNCWSDGIKLTGLGTKYITLTNLTIRNSALGHGILTSGGEGDGEQLFSIITHCTVLSNGWHATVGGPFHQIYVQHSDVIVENCFLQGSTNTSDAGLGYGIHYYTTGTNFIARNNFSTGCIIGIGIVGSFSRDVQIYNNILDHCGVGIAVRNASNVMVLNNTCSSNSSAGVQVSSSTNVTVENNITVNNQARGIEIFGNVDTIGIRNNLSYTNSWGSLSASYADLDLDSSFNVTTNNNLFRIVDINATTTTNVTGYDAKFVNPAISNFRLQTGSDAIRRGKTQTGFTTDRVGHYRGATNWDMGADDYAPGSHAINMTVGIGRVLNP